MPPYALRYVFFGTRWGSNSSFAMVNALFTSFCPANILLPCPASDPTNCQLSFPKQQLRARAMGSAISQCPWQPTAASGSNVSQTYAYQSSSGLDSLQNSTGTIPMLGSAKLSRKHLQFPVLVPLWRIYVKERPLPIFLHTSFMTVASLLWPLQVSLTVIGFNNVWMSSRQLQKASSYAVQPVRMHVLSAMFLKLPDVSETCLPDASCPLACMLVGCDSDTIALCISQLSTTLFMQLWKSFRQSHLNLHRKLGYVAVTATALGSLSGAPYAISYLCSSDLPAQVSYATSALMLNSAPFWTCHMLCCCLSECNTAWVCAAYLLRKATSPCQRLVFV